MRSAELARRIGVSLDTFHRRRGEYCARDKMPLPLSSVGHPRWDRATIEAWLRRYHPLAPAAPANDIDLVPATSDEQHRAELHAVYGRR